MKRRLWIRKVYKHALVQRSSVQPQRRAARHFHQPKHCRDPEAVFSSRTAEYRRGWPVMLFANVDEANEGDVLLSCLQVRHVALTKTSTPSR